MTVITGPNGGGKTSLAKLIAGLITPTEGQILLDGQDITRWDMTERARHGIGYAFQQPVKFKGLTVRDLLEISAEGALNRSRSAIIWGKWASARRSISTEWWTQVSPGGRASGSRSHGACQKEM